MAEDKRKPDYYSDDMLANVPTPPDQQDVSPIDKVSDAVEEMMDTIQEDLGLEDDNKDKKKPIQ